MHSFIRKQETFKVAGTVFGGQPGENPTVLFGTVFYGKEFKTIDDAAIEKAKQYISSQQKLAEETGVPALLDVYIKEIKNVETELDFIIKTTDNPFSIDSSDAATRAAALEYADKQGILDRVVYNSINLGITKDELDALGKHTPDAAIVLAYNPRDMSVDGRAQMLEDGAGMIAFEDKGLLDIAQDAGIKKLMLDTGATPFGSMSCETLRAIPVFKNKWGLPTGCSIHNTLESWSWMKDHRKEDMKSYDCANAAANSLVPLMSGDFIVYGPVSSAPVVIPSVAFADKLVAEGAADYFGVKISDNHPYNMLK